LGRKDLGAGTLAKKRLIRRGLRSPDPPPQAPMFGFRFP
jgi:hypothetical protein